MKEISFQAFTPFRRTVSQRNLSSEVDSDCEILDEPDKPKEKDEKQADGTVRYYAEMLHRLPEELKATYLRYQFFLTAEQQADILRYEKTLPAVPVCTKK